MTTADESRALVAGLTGYTPPPWIAGMLSETRVATAEGRGVCSAGGYQRSGVDPNSLRSENVANARLIAASPDLVEHLTAALDREAALAAENARLREALGIADAWLGRWASHVGTCLGGARCGCGLEAVRCDVAVALAQTEDRKSPNRWEMEK